MESPDDGIFVKETNHKSIICIGNLKIWKVNMHTTYQSKIIGNGVETFPSNDTKNVYRVQKSRWYSLDLTIRVCDVL